MRLLLPLNVVDTAIWACLDALVSLLDYRILTHIGAQSGRPLVQIYPFKILIQTFLFRLSSPGVAKSRHSHSAPGSKKTRGTESGGQGGGEYLPT